MNVLAEHVMQRDVKSVCAELSIADLISRFAQDDVSGFPVVENSSVIGIVSSTDVFRHAGTQEQLKVRDVMNRDVVSVDPKTTLHDAAVVMSDRKIHRVLVLQDKVLVGVLSALDLVRACGDDRINIAFAPPKTLDF